MEDRRLLRVEVLRLALAHHAAAERDRASVEVGDREHDPAEEAVLRARTVAEREVRLDDLVAREARVGEMAHERVTGRWRVAEPPALGHVRAEAALCEILARLGSTRAPRAHELLVEVLGCGLARGHQPLLAPRRQPGAALLHDVDARALSEAPDGIGEVEVLGLHHKAERVAATAAAEAVPQLGGGVDLEARGLLAVERTVAPEQAPLLLQDDRFGHERDQIGGVTDARDVLIGNAAHDTSFGNKRLGRRFRRETCRDCNSTRVYLQSRVSGLRRRMPIHTKCIPVLARTECYPEHCPRHDDDRRPYSHEQDPLRDTPLQVLGRSR